MPKKSDPEKIDFSPKINIEPRLESVEIVTIKINPDKMYRKKAQIDQAEINNKTLLHEANNIIELTCPVFSYQNYIEKLAPVVN